jgi:hypothetical protein
MATWVLPNAAQATESITITRSFWVRVRSAMVTVEQLLSRQIALFRAVGNTVEHGNGTVQ